MAVGALFIDRKATKLKIEVRSQKSEVRSQKSEVRDEKSLTSLADAILQAARIKFTKTEYISCPGCGRTLYNLQETIAKIKAATSHLVGLKIGIMGCIVNGPGEMADADYGYVGAGRGKISLYKQKVCIEKNIPEEEAVDKLLELIEKDRKAKA
jgi:(E)-4-hydroxy-3-methylbut-2-enyl-diphosphate synthase